MIITGKFKKITSVITLKPFDTSTESGRAQERYRKVVLSAGSSVFHKGTTIVTGLVSVPLTVNYLGTERFGLWMVITSVLALMKFADLGLGNGLINAVARSVGENNHKHIEKAISSTFFMLLAMASLLAIIFFSIYPFIPWHDVFNVKSKIAIDETGPTLMILMIYFLINLPLDIIQKVQLGYQNGYQNNLWLGLGAVLGLIGVLIAIYFKLGLPYLVGMMVLGPLIAIILNGILLLKSKPYIFPKLKNFSFITSKKLLNIGIVFFFCNYLQL